MCRMIHGTAMASKAVVMPAMAIASEAVEPCTSESRSTRAVPSACDEVPIAAPTAIWLETRTRRSS